MDKRSTKYHTKASKYILVSMTRTSIKIIYLTLLWTLTCPFLQCFSPPNPLNYIALLTSIQSLQAISLKVSEESFDKVNEVLRNNPDLLKQLIDQSGSSKSKLSSLPQGVPLMNGVSSIFPRFGTGMYSVRNPVTVALPEEFVSNGQKYVLTNRLQRLGNFFKKVTSAITSPISSSFNYLKNVGQNQGVLPDVLKSISNRLKIDNGNEEDVEEEEEEEIPKKSKKKKVAKNKGSKKEKTEKESESEEEKESEEEEEKEGEEEEKEEESEEKERPNKSKKKGTKKKKAEEESDEEEEEERTNKSKEKGTKKKKEEDEEEEKEKEGDDEEEKNKDEEEEEVERRNKSKKKDSKRKKEDDDEEERDEDDGKEKDEEEGDEEKEKDEDEDEDEED